MRKQTLIGIDLEDHCYSSALCTGCHMLCLRNLTACMYMYMYMYCLNCHFVYSVQPLSEYDEIMRSKMGVIKGKTGTIGTFEQERKAKREMGKKKSKFGQGLTTILM